MEQTFGGNGPLAGQSIVLGKDQIKQIAAFQRALEALEIIRSSNSCDARVVDPDALAQADALVDLSIAETTGASEILTKEPVQLFADGDAVQLLQRARHLERLALEQDPPDANLLGEAIDVRGAARVEIVRE